MLTQLARDGSVARILDLAVRAHELFNDETLMLLTLPIPGPCDPPARHTVSLSSHLVDAALAFILFCAKSEEDQYADGEAFFPTLHDLQYPGTVQALLGHFLQTPRHGVTFTRIRVREGHFTTMLAAARALPRAQFVESGQSQPVRVLFADPCIGGGVLYKKGAQEEALLREAPSLLAVMPLATYLECGDRVSQAQEALVLAAEGGPTFVALDAARFQVLVPPYFPAAADQFSEEWVAREASKALAGFLGTNGGQREGDEERVAVSTAAWGCGTYKGDVALKFVLQWLAAAAAGVSLVWECSHPPASTFSEEHGSVVHALSSVSPSDVWARVCQYGRTPVGQRGDFCQFLLGK